MFYFSEFHEKIFKIQAKENLSDKEMTKIFGISLGVLYRWYGGSDSKTRKVDFRIQMLKQDLQIHPYAPAKERSRRLGVSLEAIRNDLSEIRDFSIFKNGDLCCCINEWLNNLPQEERKRGELFHSRIVKAYETRSPLLDLSQLALYSLPVRVLGHLDWLRVLDLSDNLLTTLAGSDIEKLRQLQYIDLSGNLFASVEALHGMPWLCQRSCSLSGFGSFRMSGFRSSF